MLPLLEALNSFRQASAFHHLDLRVRESSDRFYSVLLPLIGFSEASR